MKKVLIIGAGKGGTALIKLLNEMNVMEIAAVIDQRPEAEGFILAKSLGIPTSADWHNWLEKDIDIVIEATGSEQVLEQVLEKRKEKTVVIPSSIAYIITELLGEKESLLDEVKAQADRQELIFNHLHEGMIVIDANESVIFANRRAEEIVEVKKPSFIHQPIRNVIEQSRLPEVLRSRKKEVNQKLQLENGKKVISTRSPIVDENGRLKGAFAIFRDITEVVELAEQVTGLKEVKKMLEAIFYSSEEAISVVDEEGKGIMINPAYTRITGLEEKDVVGKPATTDISEGESMHLHVLRTRKPVRGARMKVGPAKKDVLVNVAPVIVDGKLKGSVGVLHDVTEIASLTNELKRARQIIRSLEAKYTFDDIIGQSNEMTLALEQAKVGAKTPATVLLRGESGTGKELFAHAIHNESRRKNNKFIRVNCVSVSASVLERELFGSESDTSAKTGSAGKKGYFEEADKGSIFLDEIGELPLPVQGKLLQVLQEQEIVRVGGSIPIPVNVRVITATSVNLEKAITNGSFREDLYYRLNRLPIFIPPLRERLEDLDELTDHLIKKINEDYGRHVKKVDEQALDYLKEYDWPGNVRELENVIARAMIYMDNQEDTMALRHFPLLDKSLRKKLWNPGNLLSLEETNLQAAVEKFEKQMIFTVLVNNKWNKTKTAESLGISIRNLYYKMEKYKIEKEDMQNFS